VTLVLVQPQLGGHSTSPCSRLADKDWKLHSGARLLLLPTPHCGGCRTILART